MKKIRMLMVSLTAACATVLACTPQEAKTVENDVLSVADAACVVENALTLVSADAVIAFCKIEPQLRGAVQQLMGSTQKAAAARAGCAPIPIVPAGDGGK